MKISAVGVGFPAHYYDQTALIDAANRLWSGRFFNPERLKQLQTNVLVGGRHLALPLERYGKVESFSEANDVYIEVATEVGETALREALTAAGLGPRDIDHLFFVSVTGIATPSIDARLVNRMGLRSDIKRTPIFGLGCVAGAAGVARAADYVKAYPNEVAVLLSVELCSLTLQRDDLSIANLIASGLFGDGGAAVVIAGANRPERGPRIVASRSVFYPNTEEVMGWRVTSDGFRVVLSSEVPAMTRHLRGDAERFLEAHGLGLSDIARFVCHSGGPKVLAGVEEAFGLSRDKLALSWKSLAEVGNLSSASVLMVLRDTLADTTIEPRSHGLMIAMGPGFCSELVLLQW
ncbi:MAG TPA: 3-oxoacyl-[acyl-carrier-protein] synthase III C-terminal domain-containing protein [Myxococcota bacterium]|nr:3-oxoacyl-[acyl-carrier-protein] synthase III C-terminal domain-containing protein [Myxococcota bacterium]